MSHFIHKRVGIFSLSGYDIISNPFINTVKYLANNGFKVDIFSVQSDAFSQPDFKNKNVNYFTINSKTFFIRFVERFLRILRVWSRIKKHIYDFIIGFDPEGLFYASLFGFIKRTPYIYHNLEIYPRSTLNTLVKKIKKKIEILANKYAVLSITQDEIRAPILARENKIELKTIFIVYNTSIGGIITNKDNIFRDRFNIPEDCVIVLAVGSLIKEHMIDAIVQSVRFWSENFVLVLHGWFSDKAYEKEIRSLVEKYSNRIFISSEILPIEEKNKIFQSVDIGLVFFDPVNENVKYVGAAAGKLFDFLQCGVPVISNNLPGMKELIEENKVGFVVNDKEAIGNKLVTIVQNFKTLSHSSYNTFKKYSFQQSYKNVLDMLRKKVDSKLN